MISRELREPDYWINRAEKAEAALAECKEDKNKLIVQLNVADKYSDNLESKLAECEREKVKCKWTYSEGEEYYDTECGKAFQLSNEYSLASNGFRFCCYCGAALTEAGERPVASCCGCSCGRCQHQGGNDDHDEICIDRLLTEAGEGGK